MILLSALILLKNITLTTKLSMQQKKKQIKFNSEGQFLCFTHLSLNECQPNIKTNLKKKNRIFEFVHHKVIYYFSH